MFETRFRVALPVVLAVLSITNTAFADTNLNCQAYAGIAVAQQEQNVALGCGFTGGGWSADFSAHFQWCQLDVVKMINLATEDNARKAALNDCAQAPVKRQQECQEYASNAVLLARMSNKAQCGLQGGRYSEDYAFHFDWCLTVDAPVSNGEDAARLNQVQGCLTAKQSTKEISCRAYAETAVFQNEENIQRNCGFGGGRWSNDTEGHYNWCMGAGDAALQNEAGVRNVSLRDQCKPKIATSQHCWTETRAQLGIPPWKYVRVCKSQ